MEFYMDGPPDSVFHLPSRLTHTQGWRALAPALKDIDFEYKWGILFRHMPEKSWIGPLSRTLSNFPASDRFISAIYARAGKSEYPSTANSADLFLEGDDNRTLAVKIKEHFAHAANLLCGPIKNYGSNEYENLCPLPLYEKAFAVAHYPAELIMVNINGELKERLNVDGKVRTSKLLHFRGVHPGGPSDDDNVKWTSAAILEISKKQAELLPAGIESCMVGQPYNALGIWASNCGTCIPKIADFIGRDIPDFFRQNLPCDIVGSLEKTVGQPSRPGMVYIDRETMYGLNTRYAAFLKSQSVT